MATRVLLWQHILNALMTAKERAKRDASVGCHHITNAPFTAQPPVFTIGKFRRPRKRVVSPAPLRLCRDSWSATFYPTTATQTPAPEKKQMVVMGDMGGVGRRLSLVAGTIQGVARAQNKLHAMVTGGAGLSVDTGLVDGVKRVVHDTPRAPPAKATVATQTPITAETLLDLRDRFEMVGVDLNHVEALAKLSPSSSHRSLVTTATGHSPKARSPLARSPLGRGHSPTGGCANATRPTAPVGVCPPRADVGPFAAARERARRKPRRKRQPKALRFEVVEWWKGILMNLKGDRILHRRAFVITVLQVRVRVACRTGQASASVMITT